ncbi:ornithine cyclodeaminase family protein [Solirhodobacter olei]|uniref:ornithine cyclodeaminase family protein n=1 Tax=Solirhodobacter olei TaxID=2493082 RepID=UPI000FD8D84D|nr:ornithine cyclodeaminase [Solirhodobacter olei]
MSIQIIGPEIEPRLDWAKLTEALEAGHRMPRAAIGDTLLHQGKNTILSRSAWIAGMGALVKTATIYPGNPGNGLPSINGSVCLFRDETGVLEALVDFGLVTKWKTAGDSLLSAKRLARPDSRVILLVGAGAVARSMVEAYGSAFPGAQFIVWNRSAEGASRFAAEVPYVTISHDLPGAVAAADIICTATMSKEPLIKGEWLSPGTHLDLIGAYTPEMREVDDTALKKARIFVDSRDTTLHDIGELKSPLSRGVIAPQDVLADFYDLETGAYARRSASEITIAKNGGGAHLDLMTARYILATARGT